MDTNKVKIVCISDTHGQHRSLQIPEGEILIHAGDFTKFAKQSDMKDFNAWLATLPHPTKIVVSGNHEESVFKKIDPTKEISNAIFLNQTGCNSHGLKIYGTKFFWKCPSGNPYYDLIPSDVDILVSHSPPEGILDGGLGCPTLLSKVKAFKPKLHVFGHVHHAYGSIKGPSINGIEVEELKNTWFVNAANCNEDYVASKPPIVITIEK